jgi:cupin fold WbuC family metalloprotein
MMQKINEELLQNTLNKAAGSPRRRMNHNFHPTLDANYQLMLNCLMPDTYCRPHRHNDPAKSESFIILKGRAVVFEFSDSGEIVDFLILDAEKGNYGVDFLPNTWHTILALTPCVVFESKDGPYSPINDKDFAPWAPVEGSAEASKYNAMLLNRINIEL